MNKAKVKSIGEKRIANILVSQGLKNDLKIDRIAERVLEEVNMENKMMRRAANEFLNEYKEALQRDINEEDVLLQVSSKEVIDAIIYCHRTRIELEALKKSVIIAAEKHDIAKRQVIHAINEFEDIDPDVNWSLDIFKLLVFRKTNDDKEVYRKIFEFTKEIVRGSEETSLSDILEGKIPKDINELIKDTELNQFLKDLAEFLMDTGEDGYRLLNAVLTDINLAKEIANDKERPAPVVFMACLALKNIEDNEN